MSYLIGIDQGTTGTTIQLIHATNMELIDKMSKEHPQIYPSPSLVEHNLNDIWNSISEITTKLLSLNQISPQAIVGIGITNQRETTCAFNKKGEPLHHAIVWQDRRTSDRCEQLRRDGVTEFIKQKTGLPIDPYFSATKMEWLLENVKEIRKLHECDELRLGTVDTFLLYKLTGGQSFKTDATNASRTLLCNIHTAKWDHELLNLFQIKESALPEIAHSFSHFGNTKGLTFLPDGIPIHGILGDQQAALFGQAGIHEGDMKCTYGTGAFALLNTGTTPQFSTTGLLTTIAYQDSEKIVYALEGSSYIAGAAVQWLRDNLTLISTSKEVEALALTVKESEMESLLFMPFFTGIGTPYWKAEAKASIVGITRDTHKGHLARATLEGIAFSINDLLTALKKDGGREIRSLRVDGGATSNNLLLNLQATISNLEIIKPQIIETTCYGAALAAAVGLKLFKLENLKNIWKEERRFTPSQKSDYFDKKRTLWSESIKRIYL